MPGGPVYLSPSTFPFSWGRIPFTGRTHAGSSLPIINRFRITFGTTSLSNSPRSWKRNNRWTRYDHSKRSTTIYSGTVQLLRNTEAAEREVNDSHCERGQSMLGARLSFVSMRCANIFATTKKRTVPWRSYVEKFSKFSNKLKKVWRERKWEKWWSDCEGVKLRFDFEFKFRFGKLTIHGTSWRVLRFREISAQLDNTLYPALNKNDKGKRESRRSECARYQVPPFVTEFAWRLRIVEISRSTIEPP